MLSVALLCASETAVVQTPLALAMFCPCPNQNIQHTTCIEPSHPPSTDSHLYCYSLLRLLQDEQYTALRLQLQKTPSPKHTRCNSCRVITLKLELSPQFPDIAVSDPNHINQGESSEIAPAVSCLRNSE
jgi:hypothetical protein